MNQAAKISLVYKNSLFYLTTAKNRMTRETLMLKNFKKYRKLNKSGETDGQPVTQDDPCPWTQRVGCPPGHKYLHTTGGMWTNTSQITSQYNRSDYLIMHLELNKYKNCPNLSKDCFLDWFCKCSRNPSRLSWLSCESGFWFLVTGCVLEQVRKHTCMNPI